MNISTSAIALIILMCLTSAYVGWMTSELSGGKTYFTIKSCPVR